MKLLFILTQTSYARHFESVVVMLADRGHEVRLAVSREGRTPLSPALARHPRISQGLCPGERHDRWAGAIDTLRAMADYTHYLEPAFLLAGKLRGRALRTLAKALTGEETTHIKLRCPSCRSRIANDDAGRLLLSLGDAGLAGFKGLLERIELNVSSDPGYEQYLRDERPDVVLVTPLVNLGSGQADWVKAARWLGIPVGYPVFSWDNLTTKGIIHAKPDRLFVWNDVQKQEAVKYYGIPAEHVVVTGAPRFDEFFAMRPSGDRAAFCRKFGLDAGRPNLTYLCSSEFVAAGEVEFVTKWIEEIRRDPRLADCNVVIRPHPRALEQWSTFTPGSHVTIAASGGMNADQLLYDTLFHSAAVVGLNTSAQIEAGILGKPVCTMLAPGFERGQQGTLHFQYLLAGRGGFVEVAEAFEAHRAHLRAIVDGHFDTARVSRFIEAFVRPAGLSTPATPILADAIEDLARAS